LLSSAGSDHPTPRGEPQVAFRSSLVSARFVRRVNRFVALVRLAGRDERVHVRNSGRLRELLTPGRRVWLEPTAEAGRRTRFTLALVRRPGGYVSVDALLPNALIEAGLQCGAVPGLRRHRLLRREPLMGRKRADFLLVRAGRECLVEVKSVTLVRRGTAFFPDAPTVRGRAHLDHLVAERGQGKEATILFVIQRDDAVGFAPNRNTDPGFAAALAQAARTGVKVRAVTCRVSRAGVRLGRTVPVRLRAARDPGAVGNSCPPREMR
jgi:sugar fermentation stimulation protein A